METKRLVEVAFVPVAVVKLRVAIVPRREKRSVCVALILSRVVMVLEAEKRFCMVDEPFAMSEPGILTRPLGMTLRSEVVAEPVPLVEEATSKKGPDCMVFPCMPMVAKGVVVPRVRREV